MKKIDNRIVKSKEALHQAFFELLINHAFEEMTITTICKQAKVNRGTFYRHYETKEDLLTEITTMISNDIVHAYYEPYEANPKLTPETLDYRTIGIFQHIYNYQHFYKMIFAPDSSINLHTIFYNQLHELILDILHFQHDIKDVNHGLLASYQTYAVIGMIIEWVRNEFSYSVDYMNEQLIRIIQIN